MNLTIHLETISDTTFGRGDGVAGLVDQEVEYDTATGLPFLRGRTLKGLLVEECANILYALKRQSPAAHSQFENAGARLFGRAGSSIGDDAILHVGAALLPSELRDAVAADIKRGELSTANVLESLTAIRRQTAVDDETGAPAHTSLRSMRVVLRGTPFMARLSFDQPPSDDELGLLAACAMSLRRAGTGRNRGRGRLRAELCDEAGVRNVTATLFAGFKRIVGGQAQ